MTTTTKNRPAATLTDGLLKAAIWRNEGESGAYYSVTFSRSFKGKGGRYADTASFSGSDLLRVAKLAERAYDHAQSLREQARTMDQGGAA